MGVSWSDRGVGMGEVKVSAAVLLAAIAAGVPAVDHVVGVL